jgi:hypothetical protein
MGLDQMTGYGVVGAGLVAIGLWATGSGIGSLTSIPPVEMRLLELKYEDGHFIQKHEILGGAIIQADWTAQILRGDTPLCEGGGTAPYDGDQSKRMTPDYWTYDECPDLMPGDTAIAAWTYTGSDGVVRTISGKITLE